MPHGQKCESLSETQRQQKELGCCSSEEHHLASKFKAQNKSMHQECCISHGRCLTLASFLPLTMATAKLALPEVILVHLFVQNQRLLTMREVPTPVL
jgi:hypothetical protein